MKFLLSITVLILFTCHTDSIIQAKLPDFCSRPDENTTDKLSSTCLVITPDHLRTCSDNVDRQNVTEIRILNIAAEGTKSCLDGLSRKFPNLVYLTLSSNNLTEIKVSWFKNLYKLQHLTVKSNRLSYLPNNLTNNLNLISLNLSHNQFKYLQEEWLGSSKTLIHLNLSHNFLQNLTDKLDFPNLNYLDLSNNELLTISEETFAPLKQLKELDLRENKLETLGKDIFREMQSLLKLYLSGNHWSCDSNINPLDIWLRDNADKLDGPQNVTCNNTKGDQQNIFFQNCTICQTCKCEITRSIEVDCSHRGLLRLPQELPTGTKVLNASFNKIDSLDLPEHFSGWEKVLILDLTGNRLSSSTGLEGIKNLRELAGLNISRNQFSYIPVYVLDQIVNNRKTDMYLYLGDNPWKCACDSASFSEWLRHYNNVKDRTDIKCSDESEPSLSGKNVHRLSKLELCPQTGHIYLDILIGIMSALILLILSKLLIDYYRQKRTGKLPRFFSL